MNILVIPSWYTTKEKPLSGVFFREQAKALAAAGHKVRLAVIRSDGGRKVSVDKTDEGNFAEYIFHHKPLPMHLTYFRIVHYLAEFIRKECKNEKPDVIHVHSFGKLKYALALRALFGIPVVVTEHTTLFERGMLSEKKLKEIRRNYNKADRVMAVSPGLRNIIQPLCKKEILVVPNMVDERFFCTQRKEIPGTPFRFVSVAMLNRKKGLDILLNAFAKVREAFPQMQLTVCGGGIDAPELFSLAEKLHLGQSVVFTGELTREQCSEKLSESHAFVLPSRNETFGVVYIEAMACGLPIVMTKTGAWEMLVAQETGLSVEIEDVDGLAEAMKHLMENYNQYDPETIRNFCRARFSETAVCQKLTEVYEAVIKERK